MIFSAEQLPEVCRGHPTASFTLVFTVFLCDPDRNIVPKRPRCQVGSVVVVKCVLCDVWIDMRAGRQISMHCEL
jgi:hypothetical protein